MKNRTCTNLRNIVMILIFVLALTGMSQISAKAADNEEGWVIEDHAWKYKLEDGTYLKNSFKMDDGYRYYFDADGIMATGWFCVGTRKEPDGKVYKNWYYATPGGKIVSGWRKIGGKSYYFYLDGRMAVNAIVDDGRYFVDANGVYVGRAGTWQKDSKGWWYQCVDAKHYWSLKLGKYVSFPSNDVCYIEGDYYGFNRDGYAIRGWHDFGWSSNGKHVAAWFYFDTDYKAVDGWKEIKGKRYYFDHGYMLSNTYVDGCYLGADGAYVTPMPSANRTNGAWKQDAKGYWYRYADGTFPRNERVMINGTWYGFDASGYMQTGWKKTNGSWYYYKKSGGSVIGWYKIGDIWYYFGADGAMYSNTIVDGYYLNVNGECTGRVAPTTAAK